jgi:hypothetical protein
LRGSLVGGYTGESIDYLVRDFDTLAAAAGDGTLDLKDVLHAEPVISQIVI